MIYVLPMAGRGSRFRKVGINTPKPLIKLADQELVFHSLEGLPITLGDKLILISIKSDNVKSSIQKKMKLKYPGVDIHWIEIDEVTEGQLCTVLLAKSLFDQDQPILIHNCDTSFRSSISSIFARRDIDGAISCFKATGSQWSFAKFNAEGFAVETAEKKEISNDATIGLYYFRSSVDFVREAEKMIVENDRVNNEFYIAPLYNRLINQGKKFICDPVISFKPIGTPEDLERYWGLSLPDILQENKSQPTLVMDLDGTLCEVKVEGQSYADVAPLTPMIERLRQYKSQGFRIAIFTARNMQTQNANVGAVIANVGEVTIQWLRKHQVPYDEIHFGKPWGQKVIYVDDRAVRPNEFLNLKHDELLAIINTKSE